MSASTVLASTIYSEQKWNFVLARNNTFMKAIIAILQPYSNRPSAYMH